MIDIEKYLIDYINDNTSYVAASNLSNPRTQNVTLELTGGETDLYTASDEYMVAVQTYGDSREQAHAVADTVRSALFDIADGDNPIAKATFGTPYN